MPWFPDFVSAVELARRQTRAAGHADPAAQYLTALEAGDSDVLETIWPGEVVVYDPLAGVIRGHKQLRDFIRRNQAWEAKSLLKTERVSSTRAGDRAVVELLAHLAEDGREVLFPLAVVAESPDDRKVVFRTYCSHIPLERRHYVRSPILEPAMSIPGDVVGRYLAALEAGDTEAIVSTFAPDGYFREPPGPDYSHRGTKELRSFFFRCFSAGGGLSLEQCASTDDGLTCAMEYNLVRWGSHDVLPQAGVAIFERGGDGLLAAVRMYDDVQAPYDAA